MKLSNEIFIQRSNFIRAHYPLVPTTVYVGSDTRYRLLDETLDVFDKLHDPEKPITIFGMDIETVSKYEYLAVGYVVKIPLNI